MKEVLLNALPYRNQVVLISRKQSIKDIVHEVLEAHKHYAADYDRIAEFFNRRDLLDTFRELYSFCKEYVPYDEEKESRQTTKSPAVIIREAIGDCKHYASFIGGVLGALQRRGRIFKWWFAFASYDATERLPGHVFVVAEWNGRRYWIDPVLSSFNNRLKPDHLYLVKPKENNMALYRIGTVQETAMPAGIPNVEGELSISDDTKDAVLLLMQYGIADANGNINDNKLMELSKTLPDEIVRQLADARMLLHNAAVGGLFDDIGFAVKQVALFIPRNAFLGLVGLNFFGMATKLRNTIWKKDMPMENANFTEAQDKVYRKWHSLGGNWGPLRDTVKKGSEKKAILGAAPAAALPAWVTIAAACITAIMPIVNAFLQKAKQDQMPDINWNDPNNFLPTPGTSTGIMGFIERNPIIVAGAIAGAVWYFTRKKR